MSVSNALNPNPRLLLGPGPSGAHPRVLRAMTTPLLSHLDPQFLSLMNEVQEGLRQAFRTRNPLTFPVSATGTGGMETCMVNLLEPGDKVVVCVAGYFGERMAEVARRTGADVIVLERPWGQVFDPGEIRATLLKERPKVLAVVHAETSTGALQPMDHLGKLCSEYDCLLLVDAVTSLGCSPLEVDAWGIDAVFSCSQKGLSCPPGLAPISLSPRAVEAINRRQEAVRSWYLDMGMVQRYWGQDRAYHHTAPISMVYAICEGLRLLHEEGLPSRWARHLRNAAALTAGLSALGLNYVGEAATRMPQVHAVWVPDGVDELTTRKRLVVDSGIDIGGGLGVFKGKVWRIGVMGYNAQAENVLRLLAALEPCLRAGGMKIPRGVGVAAAERVYAQGDKLPRANAA